MFNRSFTFRIGGRTFSLGASIDGSMTHRFGADAPKQADRDDAAASDVHTPPHVLHPVTLTDRGSTLTIALPFDVTSAFEPYGQTKDTHLSEHPADPNVSFSVFHRTTYKDMEHLSEMIKVSDVALDDAAIGDLGDIDLDVAVMGMIRKVAEYDIRDFHILYNRPLTVSGRDARRTSMLYWNEDREIAYCADTLFIAMPYEEWQVQFECETDGNTISDCIDAIFASVTLSKTDV